MPTDVLLIDVGESLRDFPLRGRWSGRKGSLRYLGLWALLRTLRALCCNPCHMYSRFWAHKHGHYLRANLLRLGELVFEKAWLVDLQQ